MKVFKRLYLFILRSFLPQFAMTFFIVLFIVLMQFLWRYIDDLVGKGLSIDLLAELFFYAAVSMVPMALPLAILLASLMTFGNLGEKSELTAIKASGISLVKTMRPLIIFITMVAVGAFFFQNDILPKAQVKMWTLLFSAKQKSPELEIPEGAFYDQIPGYNIFVKTKDKDSGMLYDVMIYDVSKGGDNATILLADSARLAFTPDMRYLYLHMMQGEQFENLREQKMSDSNVPFRREKFLDKEILIPFDANFNKLDEGGMRKQYVGKNIAELRQTLDSLSVRIDSIGREDSRGFERAMFYGLGDAMIGGTEETRDGSRTYSVNARHGEEMPSSVGQNGEIMRIEGQDRPQQQAKATQPKEKKSDKLPRTQAQMNLDSALQALSSKDLNQVFNTATTLINNRKLEIEFRAIQMQDEKKIYRRHEIELIKKFTLSVACIIFLFIGAPLGAIIRKGGLGAPLVISVLLFLVYYIIDNTGYKLARDGRWEVWAGMWLSTAVLMPLGIFVTYKAMNDSAVFNADLYKEWFRRRLGLPESRHVTLKEVVIRDPNLAVALAKVETLHYQAVAWLSAHRSRPGYRQYWDQSYDPKEIDEIGMLADELCEYLSDSQDVVVIDALGRYPTTRSLFILHPFRGQRMRRIMKWCLPIGGLIYLISLPYARRVYDEITKIEQANQHLSQTLDKC
ncbi:MAG: LptF/LptG family permease [Lepagella sp.]